MLAIIFFILIPLVLFFYFKYNIPSILVAVFLLFIFYYTPYSFYLEPSFWQFRNMCKLNELPNNEEKYNKILGYFDVSLDTLDWEKLNERSLKLVKGFNADYVESKLEYRVRITTIQKKHYNISVDLYAYKGFSKENITYIQTYGTWHTRRFYPDGNERSGFYWNEADLSCHHVVHLKHDYAERIK